MKNVYIFISKKHHILVGYTKNKNIAKDFNYINSGIFNMIKINEADLDKNKYILSKDNEIFYYNVFDDHSKYTIPMRYADYITVLTTCLEISTKFAYAYNEIVSGNGFNFKNKYLNLISELTKPLKDIYNMGGVYTDDYKYINSFRIYTEIISLY